MCGLTGSEEGVAALRQCPALLEILVTLLVDPAPVIATDAALALINLSADISTVPILPDLKVSVVNNLYKVLRKRIGLGFYFQCLAFARQGESAGRQGHTDPV